MDVTTLGLVGGVLVLLAAATAVVQVLKRRTDTAIDPAILETFRLRIQAWWLLCAVLAASILIRNTPTRRWVTVALFGLISFWALREFITLTPTRRGDHRTLFWVFFLWWPLQYVLVGMERYELFSIVIPVYAFLFIPARIAMSGDSKRFLERTAKIQAGLLVCVYCLSYAPALLTLPPPQAHDPSALQAAGTGAISAAIPSAPEGAASDDSLERRHANSCARLLFFFVLMVQLSDVLQYAWSQVPSKHVIVPAIHPTKTWEGLLGGAASVALLGAALAWATPFPYWFSAIMSAVIAVMGFAGALTMSAIKRDRGVKDYGTLVAGHAGVLDRIDSICFAAPVFYHFTRYYLG
jgi:phosphatidate cytidylyltransferase